MRNNRPDLLLSRMGIGSPEAIAEFSARYQHRLRRLGIDAAKLEGRFEAAPTVEIAGVDVRGGRADVTFDVEDVGGQLARYTVYVNDVPAVGHDGKPVTGRRQRVTESVELSEGANEIEVAVTNAGGAERAALLTIAAIASRVRRTRGPRSGIVRLRR